MQQFSVSKVENAAAKVDLIEPEVNPKVTVLSTGGHMQALINLQRTRKCIGLRFPFHFPGVTLVSYGYE